jgi:Ca-activated chloride channel family protein
MKIGLGLRLLVVVAAIPYATYAAGAEPPASLDAPTRAPAGSRVVIKWTGPGNSMDRIGVVPAGAPDATFPNGLPCYPAASDPATVKLPEQPGEYEVRYLSFVGGKVLARRAITVVAVSATVQAPATAVRGSKISVSWSGPDDQFDTIEIVAADAPDRTPGQGPPSFTAKRSFVTVTVPEQPGEYEVRYLTASKTTLARAKLTVTGARGVQPGRAARVRAHRLGRGQAHR